MSKKMQLYHENETTSNHHFLHEDSLEECKLKVKLTVHRWQLSCLHHQYVVCFLRQTYSLPSLHVAEPTSHTHILQSFQQPLSTLTTYMHYHSNIHYVTSCNSFLILTVNCEAEIPRQGSKLQKQSCKRLKAIIILIYYMRNFWQIFVRKIEIKYNK